MGEGTLHAKFALFDDDTALVGSYNLDPRSERLNSETAIAIESAEVVSELRAHLESSDLPKSAQISWEQAQSFRAPEGIEEKFELLYALPMKSWL